MTSRKTSARVRISALWIAGSGGRMVDIRRAGYPDRVFDFMYFFYMRIRNLIINIATKMHSIFSISFLMARKNVQKRSSDQSRPSNELKGLLYIYFIGRVTSL